MGDVVPITSITSITTSPLSPDTNKWGLAVFKVRADVPNSTANQAVTFIVYGNTTLTNKTTVASGGAVPAAACKGTTSRVTSLVAEQVIADAAASLEAVGKRIT